MEGRSSSKVALYSTKLCLEPDITAKTRKMNMSNAQLLDGRKQLSGAKSSSYSNIITKNIISNKKLRINEIRQLLASQDHDIIHDSTNDQEP